MAVRYSRVPNEDPEIGFSYSSISDYSSANTFDSGQLSMNKYRSAFKYSNMGVPERDVTVVKQSLFSQICGYVVTAFCFVLTVITFPISGWKSVKIVPENERFVIFRLGRLQGTKGPGIVFIVPCIDRIMKVDVRLKAFNVPPLQLMTQDKAIVEMGADVHYQVRDAIKSITTVQDLNLSLRTLVRNTMLNKLVKMELNEIQTVKQAEVIHSIMTHCNEATKVWGVEITRLEFSPIKVLQGAAEGVSLPPGFGGEDGLSTMFQQLAGAFMGPGPGSTFQMPIDSPAGASSVVSCDDVTLTPTSGITPHELLAQVRCVLSETLVRNVGAVYQFNITGPQGGTFYLDLKHGSGQVGEGPDPRHNPDVTLDLSSKVMQLLFTGKVQPLSAYMNGQLKVGGDLSAALRLEEVMDHIVARSNNTSVAGHGVYTV